MCAYVCVSCVMRGVGVGTLRLRGSPLVRFVVEGSFFFFFEFSPGGPRRVFPFFH